jgi:hypothetical protein
MYCKALAENLIKQNDPRLPVQVQNSGCYYRSLQAIVESTCSVPLLVEQITAQYDLLQRTQGNNGQFPAMTSACWINSPDTVMQEAAKYFTEIWSFFQIGVEVHGARPIFWEWVRDKGVSFTVLQWKTGNGYHFTLANKYGDEIFDPWDGPIDKRGLVKKILYQCNRNF